MKESMSEILKSEFIPNILLVEDSKIVRMAVKIAINAHPCTLSMAESGEEALAMANSQNFDAILMDIGLGDTNGFDVSMAIREHSTLNKATLIFALTAHGESEFQQKALDAQMNGYFIKPLSAANLNEIFKIVHDRFQ